MSLASDFDTACDDLHHVMPYRKFFPAGRYRFTYAKGANRPSYRPLYGNVMVWDATTPPAVIDFYLFEQRVPLLTDTPVLHVHFVIIDCVPTINYLHTTHWWYGNNLQVSIVGATGFNVRWMHLQHDNDQAGSIGVYLFPFTP